MATRQSTAAPRSVTISDIAKRAGLSKSTVSLVLQGSPLIKPETQERVRVAAKELGYVYNRAAAALRSGQSNTVGVVINDLMNPFFAELLVGIERRLTSAGYITLMAHTAESPELQEKVIASMREHDAAGVILCPVLGSPTDLARRSKEWGVPVLTVVRPLPGKGYDFVGVDNEAGTRLATEHLLSLGHRRIAFAGGREGGAVHTQRCTGYRAALKAAGVTALPGWVIQGPPTRAGGNEALAHMLEIKPRPTAVVCYNDIVALGVLAAAAERGIAVGTELSVVGFDGILDTAHSFPPLTTIDIRPSHLGEQAAAALLARLAQRDAGTIHSLEQPQLAVRQSTGPCTAPPVRERSTRKT